MNVWLSKGLFLVGFLLVPGSSLLLPLLLAFLHRQRTHHAARAVLRLDETPGLELPSAPPADGARP